MSASTGKEATPRAEATAPPARRRLFNFADGPRSPALGCNKSMLGCD